MLVMSTWEHFHPSQWGLVIAEETLPLVAMLVLTFPAVALWGESVCWLGSLGCETLEEAGMGPEAGADADTISIKVLPDGYHLWMESSRKEFKHCEVVYQTTSGLPPTTSWECHLRSLSWKIKAINYALILKPCVWVAYLLGSQGQDVRA